MSVKLIAVDMDGTFLNDKKDYNRDRFDSLYQVMKQRGVKFVVASGNQYYQLKSFFPKIQDEIAFVAENGAYIKEGTEDIFTGELSHDKVLEVIEFFDQYPPLCLGVCGKKSAYVHTSIAKEHLDVFSLYYYKLKKVDSFDDLGDTIFKFALNYPVDVVSDMMEKIQKGLGNIITPVTSGHGDIDLIIPGLHKANGIQKLQKRWNIKDDETAAFGDAGNDVEMLKHAHYSYAMENGTHEVKKAAKYVTASNNDEGVLEAIESLLSE